MGLRVTAVGAEIVIVHEDDDGPVDLTDATAVSLVVIRPNGLTGFQRAINFGTRTAGEAVLTSQNGDFPADEPGNYQFQTTITYSDDDVIPSDPVTVYIGPVLQVPS